MTSWLSAAPRGGEAHGEVPVSAPWSPTSGCVGTAQSCTGGQAGRQGKCLHREGGHTGTGFLGRWVVPRACQCSGRIWDYGLDNKL